MAPEGGAMKTDAEVRRMIQERARGKTQVQAAARAGMSERTARKYERSGQLPSQLRQPRTHVTRPNPFADEWPWVCEQLAGDPAVLYASAGRIRSELGWVPRRAALDVIVADAWRWRSTHPFGYRMTTR